jgi:hypothetical protein
MTRRNRKLGYALLGIGWIIPMIPFIKWMEGTDKN